MNFDEKGTSSKESFLASIPNKGHIGVVEIDRGSFVKIGATASFENGMLTSITYDRPSEALAVVSLPVNILKSILSIPTAAFETRSARLKAEAAVIEAQAAVIEAEAANGRDVNEQKEAELDLEIRLLKLEKERDELLAQKNAREAN